MQRYKFAELNAAAWEKWKEGGYSTWRDAWVAGKSCIASSVGDVPKTKESGISFFSRCCKFCKSCPECVIMGIVGVNISGGGKNANRGVSAYVNEDERGLLQCSKMRVAGGRRNNKQWKEANYEVKF